MALLGREDPNVLLMVATVPATSTYIFFFCKVVSTKAHHGEWQSPYHMPIVRILWVSVREGHKNPLCMF